MPKPKDPIKDSFMFTDDIKFLQKVVILHPLENKFITLKRSPNDTHRANKWDLPGGNVHFGEKHDESLRREIREEVGIEVGEIKPVQVLTRFENNIYYLFIGYQTKTDTLNVVLSNEHTEYKWLNKEEFLKLESADFLQDLIKKIVI